MTVRGLRRAHGAGFLRSRHRLVLCNAPPDDAVRIADALVRERLAACVNILPGVQSVYQWKGEVAHDTEHALLIKTTAARMPALTARVRALHPYELPELISLPLHPTEEIAAYLDWVTAQTAARGA